MSGQNDLRHYLMKHFLILVFLAGGAELILNFLFQVFAYPALDKIFNLNQIWEDVTLSGAVWMILKSFLAAALGKIALVLPGALGRYIESQMAVYMENDILNHLHSYLAGLSFWQARLLGTVLVALLLLMLLTWLLPYILAAVSFGFTVSRKAAELEAAELAKQEAYERQRNLLLSDVAHDLKTPMTTIVGYSQALLQEDVTEPEKRQEYLAAIQRKALQMNELILLLFEYVKLDSEGFSLKLENADAAECVRELVAAMYADFEENDMEVVVDVPETTIVLSLDVIQFGRAFSNLLVNARKHNPRGTTVGINLKENIQEVELRVWDNGIVIADEVAERLFEPFVQGDASRKSKSGSGLGLSITQKIIAMHGGEVRFEQNNVTEGKTKEFIIILPKKREW